MDKASRSPLGGYRSGAASTNFVNPAPNPHIRILTNSEKNSVALTDRSRAWISSMRAGIEFKELS